MNHYHMIYYVDRQRRIETRQFWADDQADAEEQARGFLRNVHLRRQTETQFWADGEPRLISVSPVSGLISYRQTRRGDWIVCQAVPATMDIGMAKVGSPADGYTTGEIYGRADSAETAEQMAQMIAYKRSGVVVAWKHAGSNRKFADLPRQYPTQTGGYESWEAARADGWVMIGPSKTIEHYRGRVIRCVDITPGNSFGYELAIECAGIRYLESTTVWAQEGAVNKFCPAFRAGDLVDAIEAIRQWVDSDLITQAEAAEIAGITTQAVHNATRDGRLETYANDEAANPRHGGKLVSRQQVQQRWGGNQ